MLHPWEWRREKENTTSSQGILWENVIRQVPSPEEESYAAALLQKTQQQQSRAPQRDWRSVRHNVQQHLPQQEFQTSSADNDKLKVDTLL
jgi:hypothetical protein